MMHKWVTGIVFVIGCCSKVTFANQTADCMGYYAEQWNFISECTLSLDGVERINQYFRTHSDEQSLYLTDVNMAQDVSEQLVRTLENNQNITHLEMYSTNFPATELTKLGKNHHLNSIVLVNNKIDEENFLSLASNKSIKELTLGEKDVSIAALISFLDQHPINLLGLVSMDVDEQSLDELFTKHPRFNTLYINSLGINNLNALTHLTHLKRLYIDSMHVSDEDMADIASLKTIEDIEIASTDVTSSGVNHLSQLINLHTVSLRSYPSDSPNLVGVGDKGIEFIKELPHLSAVYLQGQRITKEGAMTLSQNKHLKDVQLPNNDIDDEGAIALSTLPQLKELDLDYNHIGDMAAVALAKNSTLSTLYVSDNHIGDIGGLALANTTNLINLHLVSNQLTDITAHAFANRTSFMQSLVIYNNDFSDTAIHALLNNSNIHHVGVGQLTEHDLQS